MKKIIFTLYILSISLFSYATHNRSGEITYRHLGGLRYEITITTYTQDTAPADRCELAIQWGDGQIDTLNRLNGTSQGNCGCAHCGENIGNDVRLNIYKGEHSYATTGSYTISLQDLNRNAGTINIPNSVNVPFYIETILFAGKNNDSPILLNPPIDDGCVSKIFIHNPGAYDPDGDSLSYALIDCKGLNGVDITDTYGPLVQDPITIDAITGDMIWDVPQTIGQFNFAIEITEHRKNNNGVWEIIGKVTRDLQVTIDACSNNPPEIDSLGVFCVEAGDTLNFTVRATDPDGDQVTLTATGGPFEQTDPATFPQPVFGDTTVSAPFSWPTTCSHIRRRPYTVLFKATDDGNPNLVDFETVEIRVIGPAPENPTATANGNGIDLAWNQGCPQTTGYKIYRRGGFYGFVPDSCETGVPSYTGYQLIATTSLGDTSYRDTNGLARGVRYCYLIVACYADGAESYASIEVCAELDKDLPIITHVDVRNTDAIDGSIRVVWSKPTEFDAVQWPGPYQYRLFRSDDFNGDNFSLIQTLNGINDTIFIDTLIDTENSPYSYKVAFYNDTISPVFVGESANASSVFLSINPADRENRLRFGFAVPWINESYTIYRENGVGVFDSIGVSTSPEFIDTGLVNGTSYCYKVRARGGYSGSDLVYPLINFSQEACQTPVDTTRPCPPQLALDSAICEDDFLRLIWQDIDSCSDDVLTYNVYYKPTEESVFPDAPFITGLTSPVFFSSGESISGCYAVTAVDDAAQDPGGQANESELSNVICVNTCPDFELPNVFTPNGDQNNNYFLPISIKDIEDIEVVIYNRWGQEVYKTTNRDEFINTGWDGTFMDTGNDCVEGVYFYVCKVIQRRISGYEAQTYDGFVHLFR